MERALFLDLDGVIVDFIGGVIKWYDLDITHEDVVDWNSIVKLSGMELTPFWEGLAKREFWYNLEMYPHAAELLDMVKECDAISCILTSPAWHTAGYKQDWIQDNLPYYFKNDRYLLGPAKAFCSYPNPNGSYLIDDSDANCKLFDQFGGRSILFPQPWNELRTLSEEAKLPYVEFALEDEHLIQAVEKAG